MWSNFHTHTSYCDGKKTIPEVVHAAADQGLISLGISSHAPLPFEKPWPMKQSELSAYLTEITEQKKVTQKPEIYAGLEIDFIPGKISPLSFQTQLDYTIGSIHFVDQFDEGEGWEIDGPHATFLVGYEKIFRSDIRAVISRYFELTRLMLDMSPPDIIGHLDKIKIQNTDDRYFSENDSWYQQEIKKTLDAIEDTGSIVEVNTRGIYQKKSLTTYPSPWILEQIHLRKIPVTLSSDAHHPGDLTNGFALAAQQLLVLGFKKMRILSDGKWQDVAFDENGIKKNISHHPMA